MLVGSALRYGYRHPVQRQVRLASASRTQRAIDAQIDIDDPLLLGDTFPFVPWDSLTEFIMARFPLLKEKTLEVCKEHIPMIEWIVNKVRDRVSKNRIVVLENPATSRTYQIDSLINLDGLADGLFSKAFIKYVIGDQ